MKIRTALIGISLTIAFAAATWAQNGPGYRNRNLNRNPDCRTCTSSTSLQELGDPEIVALFYMREEEKLAMDVYTALYQKWELSIFSNIAESEERHFDAIGTLIARYGLDDPAQSEPGIFSNQEIQDLYDGFIAEGIGSIGSALDVGVAIENKDIEDLRNAISATDNPDILSVYGNLLNGSYNHLAAFNSYQEVVD